MVSAAEGIGTFSGRPINGVSKCHGFKHLPGGLHVSGRGPPESFNQRKCYVTSVP